MLQNLRTALDRVAPHFLASILVATVLAAVVLAGPEPARGQVTFDFLVIDPGAGTGAAGALFLVDVTTGSRSLVADFGKTSEGPLGVFPVGVGGAVGGSSLSAVVIDRDAGTGGRGALFVVIAGHPDTPPSRTILSDFGNATQGPLGVNPSGVSTDTNGNYLVVDPDAGTDGKGAVFLVDPATGTRTLVSDFGNAGQGPLGDSPTGIIQSLSGDIAVVDPGAGTNAQGALFLVDPTTGERTLLSDFGDANAGATGNSPTGVSLDINGNFLVVDPDSGTNSQGLLFVVDAVTGARTSLSDFGNAGQGATGNSPVGVDGAFSGIIDSQAGTGGRGGLFAFDPTTGDRILLSDFGDATQGPVGVKPNGLAPTLTCPAKIAMRGAAQPESKLALLYSFRDKVLAKTAAGQRYRKLFYSHALEAAWIMARQPELRARTRVLIERFLPVLQSMVAGQRAVVSAADLAAVDGLVQAFVAKAGARLGADLRAFQAELRQGTVLREFGIGLASRR